MIKDRPVNKIKENNDENTASLCTNQSVPVPQRLWTRLAVLKMPLSVSHSDREGIVHPQI